MTKIFLVLACSVLAFSETLAVHHGYGATAPSGAVLHFSVDSIPAGFDRVFLIAEGIGSTSACTHAPCDFPVAVQRQATGPRRFTAVAIDASGRAMFSKPEVLNLAPAEAPIALSTNLTYLHLAFVGDLAGVRLTGRFGDGGSADLTRASGTVFYSGNPAVAAVTAEGSVTAIGPGKTDIVISAGDLSKRVTVFVAASPRGDLNGDGRVDEDDLNVLRDALGGTPSATGDARDLNHDGRIDQADLAILETLIK